MLDRIDTNTSEFHNVGFDSNIAKFLDYHDRTEDVHISIQSTTERIPQVVRNRGMDRFHYFQSIKNKPNFNNVIPKPKEYSNEPKNYAVTYVDQNLTKIPSEIFDHRVMLTILDLSKNKFEYFPLEIIQVQSLKVLKLDHNRIKCIPSEIVQLPNLEVLSIGHNQLQSLPLSLNKLTNLRELNLENNLLDYFAEEVTSLPNLKVLNILQNRLTYFPSTFANLTQLKELYFEWFKYSNPPLSHHQKGNDGEIYIQKLRDKCKDNQSKNIKGLSFLDFIEYFSTNGVDLMRIDTQNRTMLHIASLHEDISVIRYLISYVPELLDLIDKDSQTAFCAAISKDKHQAAKYLLKHGANPTKGGGHHGSALHLAVKRLNLQMVKEILKYGENPNRIDLDGNTPLHHSLILMTEGHAKAAIITQMLLDAGANPNTRNKENWTPLHLASRRRCAKTINWVIAYNTELQEIHGRDEIFKLEKRGGGYKWTALHIAAYTAAPELVEALCEAGVDVFKKSVNGYTPKRVINKYGVTLKVMEKYEKKWIKEHILSKKCNPSESLADHNLQNLNKTKEIKNASKNKFGEAGIIPNDYETCGYFGYFFKSKARMFAPLLGSGPVSKRNDEDSFEISPETEPDMEYFGDLPITEREMEEKDDDNDTTRLDFCTEINEDVCIEAEQYARGVTIADKKSSFVSNKNIPTHRITKNKGYVNLQQVFELDVENYRTALRTETNFGSEFCKAEIKFLKENILSDRIILSDKMKVLAAMRILHEAILAHIYEKYTIPVPVESFPLFALREHLSKAKPNNGPMSARVPSTTSTLAEAFALYEQVPQGVMGFFLSLSGTSYENFILKKQIINMLVEFKYFPAVDFLEGIINNNVEDYIVKQEANHAFNTLKGLLSPLHVRQYLKNANNLLLQSNTLKPSKSQPNKIFANLPSTKTTLSQMKRLEKFESLGDPNKTDEII